MPLLVPVNGVGGTELGWERDRARNTPKSGRALEALYVSLPLKKTPRGRPRREGEGKIPAASAEFPIALLMQHQQEPEPVPGCGGVIINPLNHNLGKVRAAGRGWPSRGGASQHLGSGSFHTGAKRCSPRSPFPTPRLPKAAGGEASCAPDSSSFAPGAGLRPGPRLKASAWLCGGGTGGLEQRGRRSSEGPRRRRGSRSPGGRGKKKKKKSI